MKNNTFTKTLLLLLINVFLIGGAAEAQSYDKVLKTDSTSWISYHREAEFSMKDLAYVKKTNDTNCLYFAYGTDIGFSSVLVGTLREDEGRLWITYADDPDNEFMLMDMNLDVGDEFTLDAFNNIIGTVVEIRHENGRKIVVFDRFSYKWYQEPIMFIEGVGRNIMPWDRYGDWDQNYQSCKFDNVVLAYSTPNEHFSNCEMVTESMDEYAEDKLYIDVYPNPVTNKVTVNFNNTQERLFIINVFNVNGNLIKTVSSNESIIIIPIDELNAGIYFIKAKTHSNNWHKAFIIDK